MKQWLVQLLGGFTIESIQNSPERHQILTMLVENLYNTVSKEDVLKLDEQRNIVMGDKTLTREQTQMVAREAETFLQGFLWKVIKTDVRYQATKKMYLESTDTIHMESGKLMLYWQDIIRSRLIELSSLKH